MKSVLGIGNAVTDIPVILQDSRILGELGLSPGSMNHVDAGMIAKVIDNLRGAKLDYIPGGSAANTVAAATMLGMGGGFIGKVGKDNAGELYGSSMGDAGIKVHLFGGSLPSAMAVTFIAPLGGERTFVTHLGAALELSGRDLEPEMFDGYDYLHLEGYLLQCGNVVERAVEIAADKGLKISFDMGSSGMVKNFRDRMCKIVSDYADIVFANEQEAEAFTGVEEIEALEKIYEFMLRGRKRECATVVKLGKKGSLVAGGGGIFSVMAAPANVVDETGAGDAYAAGFLYAHSLGADLQMCGRAGSSLGAAAVGCVGPKLTKCGWESIKKHFQTFLG